MITFDLTTNDAEALLRHVEEFRSAVSAEYGDQEIKCTLQVSKAVTGSGLSKMLKEEHIPFV